MSLCGSLKPGGTRNIYICAQVREGIEWKSGERGRRTAAKVNKNSQRGVGASPRRFTNFSEANRCRTPDVYMCVRVLLRVRKGVELDGCTFEVFIYVRMHVNVAPWCVGGR